MCADLLAGVAGPVLPGRAAQLFGYERRLVRGQVYPGILPGAGGVVGGVLYRGITAKGWDRLDRFEGAMYCRRPVEVQSQGGCWHRAQAYVVRPAFAAQLSAETWSLEVFAAAGKARFTAEYQGFRQLEE
ncbi:MAG: gamma-glutamylcyclotransferase [Candidatus Latescibacteria bacterium]|nr:gamma-glutamylcyclotransferase [Candidatus Latescibacterota bacterium]